MIEREIVGLTSLTHTSYPRWLSSFLDNVFTSTSTRHGMPRDSLTVSNHFSNFSFRTNASIALGSVSGNDLYDLFLEEVLAEDEERLDGEMNE
jgi:hypothetical protein